MRPPGSPKALEARRRKVVALLEQELSLQEIARRLGCYASRVLRWHNALRAAPLARFGMQPEALLNGGVKGGRSTLISGEAGARRAILRRTRRSKACCRAPESRKSVRRACATTFPTVLNSRNRSRFGWAVRRSPGKVNRLSAVSRL